jgi:ApbE superfamily uncharacterized protein (UPF0280 family)
MIQNRFYRNLVSKQNLISFNVRVKETDLFVQATKRLDTLTKDLILRYRGVIESYIQSYPEFVTALTPWPIMSPAPMIINDMISAAAKAGVGPMAAIAGAIAAYVGNDLISYTQEVIVENGGDIFFHVDDALTIAVFAGTSPLSLKIGMKVKPQKKAMAVCTSSGTVGHSLSFGKADAVCVMSPNCALADAAATAICNRVKSKKDIQTAINFGKQIDEVMGLVIIVGDKIGAWGDFELVSLR